MLAFLTLFTGPTGKVALWGAAILAAVVALGVVYHEVKQSGVAQQQAAEAAQSAHDGEIRDQVDATVRHTGSGAADQLHKQFGRD